MLDHVFSPYKIGSVTIPNRLVMSAMITNSTGADHRPNARTLAYYTERAKGGWGLLIHEGIFITPRSRAFEDTLAAWDDMFIDDYKKLLESVHSHGSKMFAQLMHAGRQAKTEMGGEAPSPIPCPAQPMRMPHELTTDEIKDLVRAYGQAARRMKAAGFDGISIHGGHGYLINAMMDLYANKRTDEYGGCFSNRMRFAKELLCEIRKEVGEGFPIGMRISYNNAPGGIRETDLKTIAYYLANETPIDYLDVSIGTRGIAPDSARPMFHQRAWLSKLAGEIKRMINIPVMTVSRIYDPFMADQIIASGDADFILMGRQTLADPDMPKKAMAGEFECIRHCIGCLQGCSGNLMENKPVGCLVNPRTGFEYCDDISEAKIKKHVVVIGGGPAGIEAAHAAAIRGHKVDLYEKTASLGGGFLTAAYPPGKGEFIMYSTWAMNALPKMGVNIHYNTSLTAEEIAALSADKVFIATGGKVLLPPIKGINGGNVVTAEDVLRGRVVPGMKVVIAGGGSVGAETALYEAVKIGKDVTLIEMKGSIAADDNPAVRPYLLSELERFGVKIRVDTKINEITENSVIAQCGGEEIVFPCDNVILALGYTPDSALFDELKKLGVNVEALGDASNVRNALAATREGYEAGLRV